MAYKTTIPAATESPASSYSDIQTNFEAISDLLEVDHKAFNDANQGKHNRVILKEQSEDPTTVADELALYCKEDDDGNKSLFYRPENDGDPVNLTTSGGLDTDGWCRLGCGLLIKWGEFAYTASGFKTLTFPDDGDVDIPRFKHVFTFYTMVQNPITVNHSKYKDLGLRSVSILVNGTLTINYLVIGD